MEKSARDLNSHFMEEDAIQMANNLTNSRVLPWANYALTRIAKIKDITRKKRIRKKKCVSVWHVNHHWKFLSWFQEGSL